MAFGMSAAQVGMVSVGSNLLGSAINSNSSNSAVNAQQRATDQASAENRRQYDLTRTDMAPWRNSGGAAVGKLTQMLGLSSTPGGTGDPRRDAAYALYNRDTINTRGYALDPNLGETADRPDIAAQINNILSVADSDPAYAKAYGLDGSASQNGGGELLRKFSMADFNADPVAQLGLQFGLDEGRKGIDNMAGARGMRNSGATLKALTQFGNDYGNTKGNESYNRFVGDQTNIYNRLAGLAGSGQTAANSVASAGMNMTNQNSGLTSAMGNARGAASIANGNAWSSGLQNIGNQYNQNSMLDKILNKGGNASAFTDYSGGGSVNPYSYGSNYG